MQNEGFQCCALELKKCESWQVVAIGWSLRNNPEGFWHPFPGWWSDRQDIMTGGLRKILATPSENEFAWISPLGKSNTSFASMEYINQPWNCSCIDFLVSLTSKVNLQDTNANKKALEKRDIVYGAAVANLPYLCK